MSLIAEAKYNWVTSEFTALEQGLNGSKAGEVHALRKSAFASIEQLGFPTPKNEDWKYTNVSTLVKTQFERAQGLPEQLPSGADINALLPAGLGQQRVVFIDGYWCSELSSLAKLPQGITVASLKKVLGTDSEQRQQVLQHLAHYASYEQQAFVALNTAFIADGAVIIAEGGASCATPIELVFLSSRSGVAKVSHPRVLIVAEANSKISCIEYYIGLGNGYLTNAVTEIAASKHCVVDHYKLQLEAAEAFHVSTIEISQAEQSRVSTSSFSFGGLLVRNDVNPTLNGERIDTVMNGLSVLTDAQHVDNHTVIDHAKPHCESNEWYKGIYAGRSKGVFNGTIIVRPDAQKTNAIQSNQSLLLSDQAESNAKPQLKIWADDVRCTHGATVGQLDDEAMFYLRSRGIDKQTAQGILVKAFAGDIIDKVAIEPVKDFLEQQMSSKLSASIAG